MQNSDFRTRITSLYGSQTSPMVFCIQNSDFRTRITSLYGSQTSPCDLYMHNITILNGSQPSFVIFACKTATLGTELQVSVSQTSPIVFCIQNTDFSPRIASHYGSQPSSVVLCTHNSGIMTRINSLYGSQTLPVLLCM